MTLWWGEQASKGTGNWRGRDAERLGAIVLSGVNGVKKRGGPGFVRSERKKPANRKGRENTPGDNEGGLN